MVSQDIVNSTLGHTLICQNRDRFIYSHGFRPLIISQLEDKLEEKPISCKVRKNKDLKTNKLKLGEDASTNNYIYCSEDLEEYCYYKTTIDIEKMYNTYKRVD